MEDVEAIGFEVETAGGVLVAGRPGAEFVGFEVGTHPVADARRQCAVDNELDFTRASAGLPRVDAGNLGHQMRCCARVIMYHRSKHSAPPAASRSGRNARQQPFGTKIAATLPRKVSPMGEISRRQFLERTGAATAALGFARPAASRSAPIRSAFRLAVRPIPCGPESRKASSSPC